MEDIKFEWNAGLDASATELRDNSLLISGELVNASICSNNFAIDAAEFPSIVKQIPNATLRVDHSKLTRDVIGGLTKGEYDEKNKRIMFEAEVDDPAIQRMITKGRLKYVSIGATADAFCSVCSKPTKPVKLCKCKNAHDIIKNIKLREASIITEPAYQTSEFRPVSFIASLTSALAEEKVLPSVSGETEANLVNIKKLEEKKMSDKQEIVEATTLKPAGKDASVVLGEKLEGLIKRFEKLEERFKKEDEDEAKRKKEDEESKAKKAKDEECKKEDAFMTKMEALVAGLGTKLEEALKVKVKEPPVEDETKKEGKPTFTNVPSKSGIPKDVKREPVAPEDEDEKKVKKEVLRGAKVENPEGTIVVSADAKPAWWNEIVARANEVLE